MANKTLGAGLVLSIGLAAAGCNGILDAGEPIIEQSEDTDPPEMTTTTTSGAGGAGGAGNGSVCGNGAVEQGEQCDDGNDDPNDGCDACTMACSIKPEFFDVDSGHCYRLEEGLETWDDAALTCEDWGGTLAIIDTTMELTFVQNRIMADTWIGARADVMDPSNFQWLNGATVVFDPEPEGEGDCLKIDGEFLQFTKEECNKTLPAVCERAVAGP